MVYYCFLIRSKISCMSTPRILPLTEPLTGRLAQSMTKLLPPGTPAPKLFLTVAKNEGLFNYLVEAGLIGPSGLLDRRSLAKDLRETIILRTCVATRNAYEFNLHVQTISVRMGLSVEQIADLKNPLVSPELWTAAQQQVVRLVDALVARFSISDTDFEQARKHFKEEELMDITQLVGFYVGVAMMVGLIQPEFDRYRAGPVETLDS